MMGDMTSGATYLDKSFVDPKFIWHDEQCDIDAVHESVAHVPVRLASLAIQPPPTDESHNEPTKITLDTPRSAVTPQRSATIPLRSDVWNGIEPINYHAQLDIGQDPKTFFLDLDTGSSLLWLQSQLDGGDPSIDDQNTYKPAESRTAHDVGLSEEVSYGDGGHVTASLFTDAMSVGELTLASQLIGAVPTRSITDKFRSKSSNGILGLGFSLKPDMSQDVASARNLVLNLKAQSRVKYASLTIVGPRNDPKVAAKIDKDAVMQPRGFLVIGSVDPKFYTGSISWCPQIVPDRWIVQLDQIVINDAVVFRDQRALIDTGTPYIVASPTNYEQVIGIVQGARKWTKMDGLYFTYPKSSLRKVSFVLGGRAFNMFPQDFGLGGIQLFQKKSSGAAGGIGSDATPTTTIDSGAEPRIVSSIIKVSSWPFDENLWIIGGIFLDNIVTIFDFSEKKIGFADINEEDF